MNDEDVARVMPNLGFGPRNLACQRYVLTTKSNCTLTCS